EWRIFGYNPDSVAFILDSLRNTAKGIDFPGGARARRFRKSPTLLPVLAIYLNAGVSSRRYRIKALMSVGGHGSRPSLYTLWGFNKGGHVIEGLTSIFPVIYASHTND